MAAANGTGTAAMLGRVERRISRADRGRWVQLRGVSTVSRLLGQCRRSRRRWRRRNLRILWRNDRLYSQIPRPFWRDLAGSGGNRLHRFVQLRCRPIGSFFTTARTNSRAVSLRDWNRLQFRRKKAFSHMRLYQDAVRVEYRQGTRFTCVHRLMTTGHSQNIWRKVPDDVVLHIWQLEFDCSLILNLL